MKVRATLAATVLLAVAGGSLAADWPQWRGPNRDDISQETGLHLDWSQKKPPLLWAYKQAGAGYSAPTIVGGTLYVRDHHLLFCYNMNSK